MLALVSLLACVKVPAPTVSSASPSSNVWLRSSFDTDASGYVGRFVPMGTKQLDESGAMPLACSRFITARFIDGGGVRYAENVQATTEVGARLGFPAVVNAKGGGSGAQSFKVEYTLTGKLVSEIADPEGFAACCKATPDQCSDRFIGEFLQGTGAVYSASSRSVDVGVEAAHPASGLGGDTTVKNSSAYTKAVEFPNPVYFAFKVTQTPYTLQASSCPAWVRTPPSTTDGLMIVGQSKAVKSEDAARKGALSDAQKQMWQATGATAADAQGAGGTGLQTKEWCVETRQVEGEPRYVGHVLVAVPQATIDAARRGAQAREAEVARMMQAEPDAAKPEPARPTTRPSPAVNKPGASGTAGAATTGSLPAPPAPPKVVAQAGPAMTDAEVSGVATSIAAASFSSDKLAALKSGTAGRKLTAMQAATLLRGFSFSADQLEALASMAPGITDKANSAVVVAVFTFSADKDKAAALLR
jgi:hypothetical protein